MIISWPKKTLCDLRGSGEVAVNVEISIHGGKKDES